MSLAYQERTNRAALSPGMLNHRHNAGQIFTPLKVAERAAQSLDLFPRRRQGRRHIHIVDGGIGDGQLTLAVLAELGKLPETDRPDTVRLTGIEQDPVLARAASTNLRAVTPWCEQRKMTIEASVIVDDFTSPSAGDTTRTTQTRQRRSTSSSRTRRTDDFEQTLPKRRWRSKPDSP